MCTNQVIEYIETKVPSYESVILCGIEAYDYNLDTVKIKWYLWFIYHNNRHACVLSTALDFLSREKHVHVITDAVSSRNLADR